jgi:hypothetical protein
MRTRVRHAHKRSRPIDAQLTPRPPIIRPNTIRTRLNHFHKFLIRRRCLQQLQIADKNPLKLRCIRRTIWFTSWFVENRIGVGEAGDGG